MYEHMHACTVCIRRTRAVVQATHSVTHTKSYQVIHQLIGTGNVPILRETARAEKAEPAPAPQLYALWTLCLPQSNVCEKQLEMQQVSLIPNLENITFL